jgi:hypothetical protein
MKSRFCRTPHDRHRASCSAGHRRPRAQLGPWAVRGLRWSCTALYEAAPSAVGPTGTTVRGRAAEASRRRMRISAPPAARPLLGSLAARGLEELLDPERETTRRRMRISAPPAARPLLGSLAARGLEELLDPERETTRRRMTPRHRRPRDHSWDRGLRAGRRSCATRSGPTRLRMPTLAPPAAGPARGPWAAGGPEEQRDSDWARALP